MRWNAISGECVSEGFAHVGADTSVRHRIEWIDVSKALLISLMVLAHAGVPDLLRKAICSFHMPAFFFLSGYLFRPQKASRIVLPFVLPVLVFSSVFFLEQIVLATFFGTGDPFVGVHGAAELLRRSAVGFVRTGMPGDEFRPVSLFVGFWFLVALVGARLVLSLPYCSRHWKVVGLLCLLFLASRDSWDGLLFHLHVFKAIPAITFLVCGMVAREKAWAPGRSRFWKLFLLAVCWGVSLKLNWDVKNVDISSNVYGKVNYLVFFIGAICGSLLCFEICSFLRAGCIVRLMSSGTLVVMGLHWPVFRLVRPVVRGLHLPGKLPKAIALALPTLAICCLLIFLFERWCPVLLGKGKHRFPAAKDSSPSGMSGPVGTNQ